MADVSDLILRLLPENELSAEMCWEKTNKRRSCEVMGFPALALTFSFPPKDAKRGFIFGHDETCCDVVFKRRDTSRRHFSITFNPDSGLLILVNASICGTIVGRRILSTVNQSRILEHRVIISFGLYRFTVEIPNRRHAQKQFLQIQSLYLGNILSSTPTAVFSRYTTPSFILKKVGPYSEIAQIGKGGFGEILLLCARETGDMYVAKRLHNFKADMDIKKEARALRRLSHRNIVEFKDIVEEPMSSVLVMEYLPCGSLYSGLPRTATLALEVIEQCLEGLKYLHSKGVIHRDIKPENVVLQSKVPAHVKIIDFGLATTGRATGVIGTIPYCAPEMWRGYSHSTTLDIWSLGIMVLQMGGVDVMQLASKFLISTDYNYEKYFRAIADVLPRTKRPLSDLVYRMLDEDPRTRYTAEKCLELISGLKLDLMQKRLNC